MNILGQKKDYNIIQASGNTYFDELKIGTKTNEDVTIVRNNQNRINITEDSITLSGDVNIGGEIVDAEGDEYITDQGNITGNTLVIGTQDANDVSIISGNQEKIRITNGGLLVDSNGNQFIKENGNSLADTLKIGTSDDFDVNLIRNNETYVELTNDKIYFDKELGGKGTVDYNLLNGTFPGATAVDDKTTLSTIDQTSNDPFILTNPNNFANEAFTIDISIEKSTSSQLDYFALVIDQDINGKSQSFGGINQFARYLKFPSDGSNLVSNTKECSEGRPASHQLDREWEDAGSYRFRVVHFAGGYGQIFKLLAGRNSVDPHLAVSYSFTNILGGGPLDPLDKISIAIHMHNSDSIVSIETITSATTNDLIIEGVNWKNHVARVNQLWSDNNHINNETEQGWAYLGLIDQDLSSTSDSVVFEGLEVKNFHMKNYTKSCDTNRITLTLDAVNRIQGGSLNSNPTYLEIPLDPIKDITRTWVYIQVGLGVQFYITGGATGNYIQIHNNNAQTNLDDINPYICKGNNGVGFFITTYNTPSGPKGVSIIELNDPDEIDIRRVYFNSPINGYNRLLINDSTSEALRINIKGTGENYMIFNTQDQQVEIKKNTIIDNCLKVNCSEEDSGIIIRRTGTQDSGVLFQNSGNSYTQRLRHTGPSTLELQSGINTSADNLTTILSVTNNDSTMYKNWTHQNDGTGNGLTIKTSDNLNTTGLCFQNAGSSYTGYIAREDTNGVLADIVIRNGINTNPKILDECVRINNQKVTITPELEVLGNLEALSMKLTPYLITPSDTNFEFVLQKDRLNVIQNSGQVAPITYLEMPVLPDGSFVHVITNHNASTSLRLVGGINNVVEITNGGSFINYNTANRATNYYEMRRFSCVKIQYYESGRIGILECQRNTNYPLIRQIGQVGQTLEILSNLEVSDISIPDGNTNALDITDSSANLYLNFNTAQNEIKTTQSFNFNDDLNITGSVLTGSAPVEVSVINGDPLAFCVNQNNNEYIVADTSLNEVRIGQNLKVDGSIIASDIKAVPNDATALTISEGATEYVTIDTQNNKVLINQSLDVAGNDITFSVGQGGGRLNIVDNKADAFCINNVIDDICLLSADTQQNTISYYDGGVPSEIATKNYVTNNAITGIQSLDTNIEVTNNSELKLNSSISYESGASITFDETASFIFYASDFKPNPTNVRMLTFSGPSNQMVAEVGLTMQNSILYFPTPSASSTVVWLTSGAVPQALLPTNLTLPSTSLLRLPNETSGTLATREWVQANFQPI